MIMVITILLTPNFEWFNFEKSFKEGGVKIEDGFEYHSGNNDQWLDVDTIRELIKKYNLI